MELSIHTDAEFPWILGRIGVTRTTEVSYDGESRDSDKQGIGVVLPEGRAITEKGFCFCFINKAMGL